VLAVLESLEVGRARSEYVAAVARREQAAVELERERKLRAQELSTERRLVEAQTESRLAELGVRAASERLRSVGVDPTHLADVERAAPTSKVELRSPIAGEVVEVRAAIGESIGAGTVFVVGSIDVLWLEIDVYERDLRRVRVGDTARISTVALPGTVSSGTVEHIHATVDPVRRVADVRIVLPNPGEILRPGMSATVHILVAGEGEPAARSDADGGPSTSAVFVKRAAVQLIDGQPFVFVERAHGSFEMRGVERGEDVGDGFVVRSGLRAGERVVTDGAFLLKSELLREQIGKND
jgi:cobalt-zinc-cadmium efflux system membrane fusion protein